MNNISKISRRTYLKWLGAIPFFCLGLWNRKLYAAWKGCSSATDSATAGPFFVRNLPVRTNINTKNFSGPKLQIDVKVVTANTQSPISNAKVEIWHCDQSGNYYPNDNGDFSNYKADELSLRGMAKTNAEGACSFESIVPGIYPGRRRHIHWRISAPGHQSVTTQSYWLSEKSSPEAKRDYVDRDAPKCRHVDFKRILGKQIGTFYVSLNET